MENLGDVGHVESRFGQFGDCQCWCKIGAQSAPNVPQAQKSFWTHLVELLGDVGQLESWFGSFGDSVSVGQDRCTFCGKRTIGSEIILDAPNGTPR